MPRGSQPPGNVITVGLRTLLVALCGCVAVWLCVSVCACVCVSVPVSVSVAACVCVIQLTPVTYCSLATTAHPNSSHFQALFSSMHFCMACAVDALNAAPEEGEVATSGTLHNLVDSASAMKGDPVTALHTKRSGLSSSPRPGKQQHSRDSRGSGAGAGAADSGTKSAASTTRRTNESNAETSARRRSRARSPDTPARPKRGVIIGSTSTPVADAGSSGDFGAAARDGARRVGASPTGTITSIDRSAGSAGAAAAAAAAAASTSSGTGAGGGAGHSPSGSVGRGSHRGTDAVNGGAERRTASRSPPSPIRRGGYHKARGSHSNTRGRPRGSFSQYGSRPTHQPRSQKRQRPSSARGRGKRNGFHKKTRHT